MEEWKDIEDYEGLYQVSNYGRVKSVERDIICTRNGKQFVRHHKERILRQVPDNEGYLRVNLSKNGVEEPKYIHVLVAQAFLPNPNDYTDVHHKDKNQLNNHVENLEWISKEEHFKLHESELRDAFIEAHSKTVYQYTLDGLLVNVWKSTNEVERVLGFSQGNISSCCNNKFKREGNNVYKSYIWSYSQNC